MAKPEMTKTALVTGGAKRIGKAIVEDLARHGWSVAIHHRKSAEEAVALSRQIVDAGGNATTVQADLVNETEVSSLVPQAAEALGRPLTLLVNSASSFQYDSIETADRASWDRHIEPNLRAPLNLTQSFAKQVPDDLAGNVVNIIDQRVWNLTPHFLSYTVSKAGLWTLTQTLAMALAPHIRVNGIGPGPTLASTLQDDEQFERQWRALPLQRPVDPDEIANAVRFLVATPSMTGQMLALDGGEHLAWAQPKARNDLTEIT
ncbi:MAG: SDR family oxidoreductase [Pseudomonadota bacterium]